MSLHTQFYYVRKQDFQPKTFENSLFHINNTFTIAVIYRTPIHKTRQDFLYELDNLLSLVSLDYNRIILCGDVNLHFKNFEDAFVKQFQQFMSDYNFLYHVDGKQTHRRGGSLDVVCTQGLTCSSLQIEDPKYIRSFPDLF